MSDLSELYVAGYAAYSKGTAAGWTPRRPKGIAEWADAHRVLLAKSSSEAGRWRTSRVPYARGIMAALEERHPAPLVIWKKSSQVSGTELALNWIGRTIQEAPRSFLALFPSEKDARKWVRIKLNGMLTVTPTLRRLVPPGRRSDGASTLQEKHYPDGVLITGSANIASDIASVSVPYIILDELDRMPLSLEGEGDPVEGAMARSTTFPIHKAFMISTPTTEELSRINGYWLMSTMDRYFVPCPHCGHRQHLRFDQLWWPEGQPRLAMYRCEEDACGALMEEHHKPDMLENGVWTAEHPEREAEIKGFHTNGLYSPIGLGRTWAQHAATWDRVKGIPEKVQVFFNTRLGEVVKSSRIKLEWEDVKNRREDYKLRTVPPGYLILACGVDVQHNRLEAQIVGFGPDDKMAVIDYEVFPGETSRQEVWDSLDAWLAREIENSCGVRMKISCTIVDSGDQQTEVLHFTRTRKHRRIYAGKGSTIAGRRPIGTPSYIDVRHGGQVLKGGAEQYQLGVSEIKRYLYQRLLSDLDALPADRHIRFSVELIEDYFRQLVAEVFDPKKGWTKIYDRNEALDTFVYAIAASQHHSVRVHRMRAPDWERLAETLEPKGQPKSTLPALGQMPIASGGGFLPMSARIQRK